jgi:hypothetical protein
MRGMTSEVDGMISTSSRKNTVKEIRMEMHSEICNEQNGIG